MASDESVREIRVNGKQLVFLFMATTVACVVIFLCGVMVGRGVRTSGTIAELAASAGDPTVPVDAAAPASAAPAATPPPSPTNAGSGPVQETLTYPERLEDPTPPPETLETPGRSAQGSPRQPDPLPVAPPAAAPPRPSPTASASRTASAVPEVAAPRRNAVDAPTAPAAAGSGYVVQVAAVRERSEADAIARRLASKGYRSFVSTPGTGAARVFRVRVGTFADRREAEAVASRLQKEEQFKPWITR